MLGVRQLHTTIKTLDTADDATRRQTLQSLKQLKEEDWATVPSDEFPSLVKVLQKQLVAGTKQPAIRQEAAVILGNLGIRAESAIPHLIDLLEDGVPDGTREAAATALGKIGKEAKGAVDALIKLLSNRRATLAIQVVRALSEIGCADQRVRTALVNLWATPIASQNGQVQLAMALCKLKIEANGLMRYLTTTLIAHQEAALRDAAAEALGWCNKQEIGVVPALLAAAQNDKNDDVRLRAEASLTQLRLSREKAIGICAKQLKDSQFAESALKSSGPLAVPALIEALETDEPIIREKAARILGSLGEAAVAAVPALTTTLRVKNLDVRLAAAKGLWNVTKNADAVVPVLVDLLDVKMPTGGEEGEARRRFLQTVIESLWRIGPPAKAAVSALSQKAKDKNRLISESALNALKEIAPAVAQKAAGRT